MSKSMIELESGGYATESEALTALAMEANRRQISYGHLVANTSGWEGKRSSERTAHRDEGKRGKSGE